jgi:preprotein translocase subunit SecD
MKYNKKTALYLGFLLGTMGITLKSFALGKEHSVELRAFSEQGILGAEPIATLKDFRNASLSQQNGGQLLNISLHHHAGKKLRDFSKKNVGKSIALMVDNLVVASAKLREPIKDGKFVIGPFEEKEAHQYVDDINNPN